MKKWFLEQIKKKEEARSALRAKGKDCKTIEELRSIEDQIDALDAEISELREKITTIPDDPAPTAAPAPGELPEQRGQEGQEPPEQRGAPPAPAGKLNILGTYGVGGAHYTNDEQRTEIKEKYEQRGADLKDKKAVIFNLDELPEFRAVTIGGGTLVVPKQYAPDLSKAFNEVSSLIDVVNAVPLMGGESYEKGFVVGYGEGDYTTETGNYTETDPAMDYVSIGKAKITAYTEMSDESIKLPNINYQSLVARNISIALRKKIARQIMAGAGTANTITGIFNAPAKVIPTASDLGISEIDADTLDNIVFGYGGDEDIEGGAYLILNKADLAAFAAIRGSDGKKLYNIKLNGNTGTISSDGSYAVRFIINSACPALSASGTAVDAYCMAYGMPAVYEMPMFSPVEVMESREYKFRTGQIAFRGTVWVGGNVGAYKGFVRIKKSA